MPTIRYFYELDSSQQLQARALVGDLLPEWHCYLVSARGEVEQAVPLHPIVETGRIKMSTAARAVLASLDRREMEFVIRHAIGDWSELPSTEHLANQLAIAEGGIVSSRFSLDPATWVYVTTQADRCQTHVSVGRVIPANQFPPVARLRQVTSESART
ncbi:hypothetical protein KTE60_31325 [Burkholderia multivorans]|nr:hypothetical protein [Burkholderia multivorans]MBN7130350.1 hypothetical protein [Burkholderia multivorans]MBN8173349.1 hypothetical protein [Burkholderia multivorans]MBU9370967.1 hypothetical protein [Burkholderia multivorans]MBU9439746.1 hypothetical protein [Burkholderia multivorans]